MEHDSALRLLFVILLYNTCHLEFFNNAKFLAEYSELQDIYKDAFAVKAKTHGGTFTKHFNG